MTKTVGVIKCDTESHNIFVLCFSWGFMPIRWERADTRDPFLPVRRNQQVVPSTVTKSVADQHNSDLGRWKDEIEALAEHYDFIGAVEMEVAA